ncbi:uncharacterized protein LOC119765334 [Culex quinquefasciatus]|uniref:uncharacterized protein LOC119765334 n=1 Tax=Culex quinquefasciatus TaxID=7176 RepID=UPI0018E3C90F|nr:uncharacterized protein LOC119765334 [Culex quinquefasciatus]
METINGFAKDCFKELNIPSDSNLLARALKTKLTTFSDQDIDFLACMGKKVGALDAEGVYHSQPIEGFFLQSGNTFNKQEMVDVVEICIGQQVRGTPYKDNVAKFNKCFYENKKFDLM